MSAGLSHSCSRTGRLRDTGTGTRHPNRARRTENLSRTIREARRIREKHTHPTVRGVQRRKRGTSSHGYGTRSSHTCTYPRNTPKTDSQVSPSARTSGPRRNSWLTPTSYSCSSSSHRTRSVGSPQPTPRPLHLLRPKDSESNGAPLYPVLRVTMYNHKLRHLLYGTPKYQSFTCPSDSNDGYPITTLPRRNPCRKPACLKANVDLIQSTGPSCSVQDRPGAYLHWHVHRD